MCDVAVRESWGTSSNAKIKKRCVYLFVCVCVQEDSDNDRKHTKLLEAISSLGGKRRYVWFSDLCVMCNPADVSEEFVIMVMHRLLLRRLHAERSEASVQVSEFSVNAEGAGEKIELSDLLGTVEKTPGAPNKTKKQLRNLQNTKETLELPLSRQQTEKVWV